MGTFATGLRDRQETGKYRSSKRKIGKESKDQGRQSGREYDQGEVAYVLGRSRARQVEQGRELGEITSGLDTEGRAGVAPLNVLKDVIVEVNVVVDELAGDTLPVDAGVVSAGNSLVDGLAANGPSGLSNPDGLALSGSNSLVVGVEEKITTSANTVGKSALEVRIGVHANPVKVVNDGVVAGIDVDLPCVDVTEFGAREAGSGNSITSLFDVVDEDVRLGTGVATSTISRDTV